MSELGYRKFHRKLGVILIVFLAVQGLTGMIISLQGLTTPPLFSLPPILYRLHHGGGSAGDIYRVILALATLLQGITGIGIFVLIKKRSRS